MVFLVTFLILGLAGCATVPARDMATAPSPETARTARDLAIDYMALYYAARAGDELLVKALLERGAPVDAPDVDSAGEVSLQAVDFDSPLQAAAASGHTEIVKILLAHKPWVDHRCCDGPAALGMAAKEGHLEIVELLLAAGADPTIQSYCGPNAPLCTPVGAARAAGHEDVARVLEAALRARK